MKKKIGILTYFWGNNPGTFLQAFSMCQALKKQFLQDKVELINYCYPNDPRVRKINRVDFGDLYTTFKKGLLSCKRARKYKAAKKKYFNMSQANATTYCYEAASRFISSQDYDLVVVGSDTILELPPGISIHKQAPVYWLSPKIKCKKVACAASAGALRYEMLNTELRRKLRDSIEDFYLVGVRDETTYELFKNLEISERDRLSFVPDPTFTYDFEPSYFENLSRQERIDLGKPTIGIDLPENLDLCRALVGYYKSNGFQIVSPRYNRYADYSLAMSPFEWAGMHKHLVLFITNSFHGTVFSLKHGTAVLTIDYEKTKYDKKGFSKTYCLLKQFGLHETNHINIERINDVSEITQRAEAVMQRWDKRKVQERASEMKREFYVYMSKIGDLVT